MAKVSQVFIINAELAKHVGDLALNTRVDEMSKTNLLTSAHNASVQRQHIHFFRIIGIPSTDKRGNLYFPFQMPKSKSMALCFVNKRCQDIMSSVKLNIHLKNPFNQKCTD